jgi:hypothetical protein
MNDLIPIRDLEVMANAFAKSKLFGAKTPEEALSLMLVAQAEGMHPASAARDYHIIQGKGSKKSEAMLRDFLKAGGRVEWHQLDDATADATFSHEQGGTVRIKWDMARVKTAKISNTAEMYTKYPRQMLRSRTVSEGVRTVCPMATGGMYAPEEITDSDLAVIDGRTGEIVKPRSKSAKAAAAAQETAPQPGAQAPEPPQTGSSSPNPAPAGAAVLLSAGQLKILRARMNGTITDAMVAAKFGAALEQLAGSQFNDIAAWLKEQQS